MKAIRVLSIVLAMCLLMTCVAFAKDNLLISRIRTNHNTFQDAQNIWCSYNIDICYQTGLMEGTSVSSFSPSTPLTYAQITIISSRLQNILSGGTGTFRKATQNEEWYIPAYQAFSAAAKDTGKFLPEDLEYEMEQNPSAPCSRTTFVETLVSALDISGTVLPSINHVTTVPDAFDPVIMSFYNAGIVNGVDDYGCFNGNGTLNRGQAAAMLARIIDPAQRLTFTFKSFDLCRDVLQMSPDTVLFTTSGKNFTVEKYAMDLITSSSSEGRYLPANQKELVNAQLLAFCHNYVAPEILANSLGITITDSERATLLASTQTKAGYKGLSADYWYWQDSLSLYGEKLEAYYENTMGYDEFGQAEGYGQAIGDAAVKAYNELHVFASFSKIDWAGIQDRIEQFPMISQW